MKTVPVFIALLLTTLANASAEERNSYYSISLPPRDDEQIEVNIRDRVVIFQRGHVTASISLSSCGNSKYICFDGLGKFVFSVPKKMETTASNMSTDEWKIGKYFFRIYWNDVKYAYNTMVHRVVVRNGEGPLATYLIDNESSILLYIMYDNVVKFDCEHAYVGMDEEYREYLCKEKKTITKYDAVTFVPFRNFARLIQ